MVGLNLPSRVSAREWGGRQRLKTWLVIKPRRGRGNKTLQSFKISCVDILKCLWGVKPPRRGFGGVSSPPQGEGGNGRALAELPKA